MVYICKQINNAHGVPCIRSMKALFSPIIKPILCSVIEFV